jgi:zinc transport system substrate-binding protein
MILTKAAPGMKASFDENSADFKTRLRSLDEEIADLFSDVGFHSIIQWHPAWEEFAVDYGLEIAGTVELGHGDTPSVKEFQQLVKTAKQKDVGVIVIGLNVRSQAVESLARETGASILRLDTIGDPADDDRDSYIELMRQNAHLLAGSLR